MISKVIAVALLCFIAPISHAQNYPTDTVKIVVPYSPGGSVDTVAREMGNILGKQLKQSVIIENKPGASANIGAAHVAKSAPDGHTLLMSAATTLAAAPSIFKNLTYDPLVDLVPIVLVAYQPNILVVNKNVPAQSVDEFIALAKSSPTPLNLGIAAVGGPAHMAGELFMTMTGTKFNVIPYKGGNDAVMDLLGGRVDAIFAPFPEAIQHVKADKLRALAVTSKNRTDLLPNTPSLHELGLKDYELVGWMALAAPKGTSEKTILLLNDAVEQALKKNDLKQRLNNLGLEPAGGSVAELKTFLDREVKKYRQLVEASGIQPL
jgi:tripartite-type tricarboxylate transporter receptor subunit TctC